MIDITFEGSLVESEVIAKYHDHLQDSLSETLVARLTFSGTESAKIEENLEESAFCGAFGYESMTNAFDGYGGAVG